MRILIPGDCPIKKNNMGKKWFTFDKKGNKIPLKFPILYYKKDYVTWVKNSISVLAVYKSKHPKIAFPLTGSYFVSFWWFKRRMVALDFDNLSQAPMDLLSGKGGNFLDRTVRKVKVKYEHRKYQVLADDNLKIITCMPTSHLFYDPINPRTEIFIAEFSMEKFGNIHNYIFKNEQVSWETLKQNIDRGEPKLDFMEEYK